MDQTSGQTAAIELNDVSYYFGKGKLRKQILHSVSEKVQPGEIVILTGPSGSGKTTLLTLIGALRSTQEGKVRVLGDQLDNASEKTLRHARRKIGYIFQTHNLLESLTVRQNIQMAMNIANEKLSSKEQMEKIESVLEHVGMVEHINKLPGKLSGGQKQRVGIARALINSPEIILADEPTASLDKKSGRDVVNLIHNLAREEGAAVIMVTHDNRVLDIADRIVHLEDGHIQSLSKAVADNTTRLLGLLEKYEPENANYITALSLGLARVACADGKVTEQEKQEMIHILKELDILEASEIDLVVEFATRQQKFLSEHETVKNTYFSDDQREVFLKSMNAIAEADGFVSDDERDEIESIAEDYGFKSN
ncbi:MAG: ATP-binding cassette domain-containing protein [Gammaproteobacteria bacterium]